MTDFVIDSPADSSNPLPIASESHGVGDTADSEHRYPLRVLLIGSDQDVRATIKNLHQQGGAETTL
jgi:hypothetical protein